MDNFKIKDGRTLPFFQVDNRLIDDCNLDTSSKLIYVALCRYSNNGSKAFPSINVLAEKCGMSASTVKRRLNELEQNKYIKRVNRASENGSKTSNLYIVSDVPYGSERPIPTVTETHPHRSEGPIPRVTVTHNKEQSIKNKSIKNKSSSKDEDDDRKRKLILCLINSGHFDDIRNPAAYARTVIKKNEGLDVYQLFEELTGIDHLEALSFSEECFEILYGE